MAYKIEEIEGIGPTYGKKLIEAGIKSTTDLLKKGATAKGRKEIAAATGLSTKQILKWANHADLMRISGVGPEYAELLEGSGVDTIKELRHRNAENLAAKMAEVREQKKLTRVAPSAKVVAKWVAKAKELEPKITY